jgi:hypothetical protein
VDNRIMAALGVLQRQQVPFQLHPELADTNNPLRGDILSLYDTIAADPTLQMIFPQDQNSSVTMAGPDGQNRIYDMRLLDRAALQVKANAAKLQGAQEEQSRQQVGSTFGSTGGGTTNGEGQVDPVQMFSEREMQQFLDPAVQRALPTEVGRDPASIAKYLVEGMTDGEKTKRIEQHRARRMGARV